MESTNDTIPSHPTPGDTPAPLADRAPRRIFPSVATGPTFGTFDPTGATQADDDDPSFDRSVLLATGLEPLSMAPNDNAHIWKYIKDGTVKEIVLAADSGNAYSGRCLGFWASKHLLQRLQIEAPGNAVTSVTFDEGILDASRTVLPRDSDYEYLSVRDTSSAAGDSLWRRTDDAATSMKVRHRTGACHDYVFGGGSRTFLPSTSYTVWSDKCFDAPKSTEAWWPATNKVKPPRSNFNLAGWTEDRVLSEFSTFCKERYTAMRDKHRLRRENTPSYEEVVNLYANPADSSDAEALMAEPFDPKVITTNEQIEKLGPQLTKIVEEAGLGFRSRRRMTLNLGECDELSYDINSQQSA